MYSCVCVKLCTWHLWSQMYIKLCILDCEFPLSFLCWDKQSELFNISFRPVSQFFNHCYESPLILADLICHGVKAVVISGTSQFSDLWPMGVRLYFSFPVDSVSWSSPEPRAGSCKQKPLNRFYLDGNWAIFQYIWSWVSQWLEISVTSPI